MRSVPEETRQTVAVLESVVGPLTPENDFWEVGHWYLRGTMQGRDLRIAVVTDGGVLTGLIFAVSLGGRPIALSVTGRNTSILGVPVVPTGDPVFDRRFIVHGWPDEVVHGVLDDATRNWLCEAYGREPPPLLRPISADPEISTESGFLTYYRHLRVMEGIVALPHGHIPTRENVVEWLGSIVGMADRAVGAFDATQAAIAASRGPEAAARWVQRWVDAAAARQNRRRKLRTIVFAVVIALVVLPILIAACVLGAAFLGAHGGGFQLGAGP